MRTDVNELFSKLDSLPSPDLRREIGRRSRLEGRPASRPEWPRRQPSRLAAAAVAIVVTAGAIALAQAAFDRSQVSDTPTPTPVSPLWDDLEPGRLTPMPEPPFVRQGSAVVWGGGGLLMWGGQAADGLPHHADGAFFDARSRTWRPVSPSPLSRRSWPAAVWAGDRFILWGGSQGDWPGEAALMDGASYDPVSDTWASLPPVPGFDHVPLTATWTGEEVVFVGGYEGETDAFAYGPALDSWRPLPDLPVSLNDAHGVWTGDVVVVFGASLGPGNWPETPATAAAYDPGIDTWRLLPESALVPNSNGIVWDGTRLVAVDYLLRVQTLDARGGGWVELPRLPTNACEGFPHVAQDRGIILVEFCGELAELRPRAELWHVVAGRGESAFPAYSRTIGADGTFLLLGFGEREDTMEMWAYSPSPSLPGGRRAWDVAAAFGALRAHYPYDPDNVGEEILDQMQPLLSPFAAAEYEDRTYNGLPRLWSYYWGFEVVSVEGSAPPYVVYIRFTTNNEYLERLTIGPGPDLNSVERDYVILDAVSGELVTGAGPYVIEIDGLRVGVLVRGESASFGPERAVEAVRCADEQVPVPPPGETSSSSSSWLHVLTEPNGEVDASCTGP